jgi:hypothetical protein
MHHSHHLHGQPSGTMVTGQTMMQPRSTTGQDLYAPEVGGASGLVDPMSRMQIPAIGNYF